MINRNMLEKHITIRYDVQHGKPCVKNTRIPVHVILEALATGMTTSTIRREFGPITTKDIQACIMFAALLADEQELLVQPIK